MQLKVNYPEEKTMFENNVAKFKALLIQKYIDDLNVSDDIKKKIKKLVCEELQKTWITSIWELE